MANSFVRYTGNGSTDAYAVPFSYRAQADVNVTIDGVATSAYTWDGAGTTITFTTAPANLTSIEIRRTTSQAARLVDYADGSVLKENDLDTDSFQAFYMGQEAIDDANDRILLDNADFQWDAQSKRIKNVADPTANTDAVNKQFITTNLPNINTVAGIASDVTTVAGIASDVTAVAGDATDIGVVAGKATEIGRLGTADAVADMAILGTADVVADMNTLATSDIVSDLNTLATSDIVTDLNSLATGANVTNMATLGASGVVGHNGDGSVLFAPGGQLVLSASKLGAYEYTLTATYSDGEESGESNTVTVTPFANTTHEVIHEDGSFESEFNAG